MDITSQVINDVEFHQRRRGGYDPDEVDDFLERVAAGIAQLQEKLREATNRAAAAERRAAETEQRGGRGGAAPAAPSAPSPAETEAVSRTLILAQRTADAAIKEAEDTAAATLSAAKEEAEALVAEAQGEVEQLVVGAEAEARRLEVESRQRIAEEAQVLEEARDAMRYDLDLLEAHLEDQRGRLREVVADLQGFLDEPDRLRLAPAPELSGATLAAALAEVGHADELSEAEVAASENGDGSADEASLNPARASGSSFELEGGLEADADRWEISDILGEGDDKWDSDELLGEGARRWEIDDVIGRDDESEDEKWARFTGEADEGGPPTQAFRIDDPDATDEDYLSELRKAGLESGEQVDEDDLGHPRSRFGRHR